MRVTCLPHLREVLLFWWTKTVLFVMTIIFERQLQSRTIKWHFAVMLVDYVVTVGIKSITLEVWELCTTSTNTPKRGQTFEAVATKCGHRAVATCSVGVVSWQTLWMYMLRLQRVVVLKIQEAQTCRTERVRLFALLIHGHFIYSLRLHLVTSG